MLLRHFGITSSNEMTAIAASTTCSRSRTSRCPWHTGGLPVSARMRPVDRDLPIGCEHKVTRLRAHGWAQSFRSAELTRDAVRTLIDAHVDTAVSRWS